MTGGLTKTLLGNSSYTEYLYSGAGNLTLLSNKKSDATLISGFAYGVDDTGNRTKMSISGTAYTSADVAYTYDDAYQLTGEVRTGGNAYSQYFYYDPNGNRTKSSLGETETVFVYNSADQLTSETAGGVTTTYLYDANGALTKSDDATTVNAYTYDYDGYQTAFDTTGTSNDATYTYDADKRRINKVVDSTTTKYFLDGSTGLAAGGADVIVDYDGDDELVATYVTPGLDANLSQTRSGSTYYYMKDGLGSVRNLVDSSEATQNTYDYYGFGKRLGSWTETVIDRYTYTAREYDSEAKQYYYRARYYSGAGRFAGRDPQLPAVQTEWYRYCQNRPASFTDPTGMKWYEFYRKDWAWVIDKTKYLGGSITHTGTVTRVTKPLITAAWFSYPFRCWVSNSPAVDVDAFRVIYYAKQGWITPVVPPTAPYKAEGDYFTSPAAKMDIDAHEDEHVSLVRAQYYYYIGSAIRRARIFRGPTTPFFPSRLAWSCKGALAKFIGLDAAIEKFMKMDEKFNGVDGWIDTANPVSAGLYAPSVFPIAPGLANATKGVVGIPVYVGRKLVGM